MAKNEDPHAANVPPVLEANFSLQRNYIGLLFILPQIEYQACIGYNIRDFSPVYSKVIGGPSYEQTAFLRYQLSGLDPGSQQISHPLGPSKAVNRQV